MSEEDFEGEGSEQPEFEAGGGGSKKKLLFIIIPIVLVLGGAAAAYFLGFAKPLLAMFGKGEEATAEEHPAEEHGAKPAEGEHGAPAPAAATGKAVMYSMPEMLVNINTAGRTKSFLKIKVTLELNNETDVARIEDVLPRIVDNFQVYLRELRVEDLQGAAGMYRLREELLNRVNAAVRPAQIKDVLFTDFLLQ